MPENPDGAHPVRKAGGEPISAGRPAANLADDPAHAVIEPRGQDVAREEISISIEASIETALAAFIATFFTPHPAAPTRRPAPSKAVPPIVSAPVPARTLPAVRIPAVPPPHMDVLALRDDAERIRSHADAAERSGRRFGTSCHQRPAGNECGHCRAAMIKLRMRSPWWFGRRAAALGSFVRIPYGEEDCPNYVDAQPRNETAALFRTIAS